MRDNWPETNIYVRGEKMPGRKICPGLKLLSDLICFDFPSLQFKRHNPFDIGMGADEEIITTLLILLKSGQLIHVNDQARPTYPLHFD